MKNPYAAELLERLERECPSRAPCSPGERKAQDLLAAELRARGLTTELVPFRFARHLYLVLALHFGVACAGTVALFLGHAWLALALHWLAAVSYTLDASRRGYILRRIVPWGDSQNLLAVRPASAPLRRRIVVIGHADAAYTGTMFHPAVIKSGTKPGVLGRPLLLATTSVAVLASLDVVAMTELVPWTALAVLAGALTLPALISFLANLEVVLRNTLVPGSNDNLTGCVVLPVMAERLRDLPDDIELVLVTTGCEEAGTGGAWALAGQMRERWLREQTVVLAVDSISNGDLRLFQDGEIFAALPPAWLQEQIIAASGAVPFRIPSGATDAMPFLARGYAAAALGCVDPTIGAPREYHRVSDTFANVDQEQLARSIDAVERVVRSLAAR